MSVLTALGPSLRQSGLLLSPTSHHVLALLPPSFHSPSPISTPAAPFPAQASPLQPAPALALFLPHLPGSRLIPHKVTEGL